MFPSFQAKPLQDKQNIKVGNPEADWTHTCPWEWKGCTRGCWGSWPVSLWGCSPLSLKVLMMRKSPMTRKSQTPCLSSGREVIGQRPNPDKCTGRQLLDTGLLSLITPFSPFSHTCSSLVSPSSLPYLAFAFSPEHALSFPLGFTQSCNPLSVSLSKFCSSTKSLQYPSRSFLCPGTPRGLNMLQNGAFRSLVKFSQGERTWDGVAPTAACKGLAGADW